MNTRRIAISLLLSVTLTHVVVTSGGAAIADSCDPLLTANNVTNTDPNRYKMRGDRCEGIFYSLVGAQGGLLLASLTKGQLQWGHLSEDRITLRWRDNVSGSAHVRAYSLQQNAYYRLDADVHLSAPGFDYSLSMANNYMSPLALGLLVWTNKNFEGHAVRVFLPVMVDPAGVLSGSDTHLIVLSELELSEVYVAIERVATNGSMEARPIRARRALGYGVYPAQESIDIALPEVKSKGTYAVDISSSLDDGGIEPPLRVVIYVE
jgi:hypothetical protein